MRRTHYLSMHDFAGDGGERRAEGAEVDNLIPPPFLHPAAKGVNESTERALGGKEEREREKERRGNFSSRFSCM